MTEPQDRKMPEGGEAEPGNPRSGPPSQDKFKSFPYFTHDSQDSTSPTLPFRSFTWPSDLELGWDAGEGTSAQIRESYSGSDIEDRIWWQIRDYSLESDESSSSPEQCGSPWTPGDTRPESHSFLADLCRSDDAEWYARQNWFQLPPGPSGYVAQKVPQSVQPEDHLLRAGAEIPDEFADFDFDFENQTSGGVMPRPEVSTADPQAPKENLDSWAPLYRYLGVRTEYDYADTYEFFQPLETIMESPLEEENSDDTNEGAVGGAPK